MLEQRTIIYNNVGLLDFLSEMIEETNRGLKDQNRRVKDNPMIQQLSMLMDQHEEDSLRLFDNNSTKASRMNNVLQVLGIGRNSKKRMNEKREQLYDDLIRKQSELVMALAMERSASVERTKYLETLKFFIGHTAKTLKQDIQNTDSNG